MIWPSRLEGETASKAGLNAGSGSTAARESAARVATIDRDRIRGPHRWVRSENRPQVKGRPIIRQIARFGDSPAPIPKSSRNSLETLSGLSSRMSSVERVPPTRESPIVIRIVLVVCVLAGTISEVKAELQVGAAVRIITPDPLLPVSGGMGMPKPAKEKRGELTARAIVFRKGDTSVAVVSLDLLGFPSVLGDRVRAKVASDPCRQTFSSARPTPIARPDCYAFPDGQGGHTGDLKYMDFVCDKAAEAINEAIDHLQPASLKIATGEAKGKIAYNYYAPDLYDRRMSVIQAVSPQGKTIATLVNYAIHPEVLGNGVGILSPDLIGPLCDESRRRPADAPCS